MVSVSKSLNLILTISFFHATRSGLQFNVLLEHNSGPPHHLPHPVQQHVGGQLTAPSTDPRLIQDAFMQPPHHLPPQHHNTVRELATFLVKLFKPKVVLIWITFVKLQQQQLYGLPNTPHQESGMRMVESPTYTQVLSFSLTCFTIQTPLIWTFEWAKLNTILKG